MLNCFPYNIYMKNVENDPCPCGSGKKYKNCCMKDRKILPFFRGEDSESFSSQYVNDPEMDTGTFINGFIDDYNDGLIELKDERIYRGFKDLLVKGPFKAGKAVTINRKINTDELKNVPLIQIMRAFLKFMEGNGGAIAINKEGFLDIDSDTYIEFLSENTKLNISATFSTGELLLIQFNRCVEFLLIDTGYTEYRDYSVRITEKGLKFLNNRGLKAGYFGSVKYLTEKLDWFFGTDFPDCVLDIQNSAGVLLYIIFLIGEEEFALDKLIREIELAHPFLEYFSESGIGREAAINIFNDYFLWNYCYFSGFILPVYPGTENELCFKTTKLFSNIFNWNI